MILVPLFDSAFLELMGLRAGLDIRVSVSGPLAAATLF
jgi:hypothetical protein